MPQINKYAFILTVAAFCWLMATGNCRALQPDQILVLANRNAAKSISLAKYYMEKRRIPEKNLLRLFTTDKERCGRDEYEKRVRTPVLRHLTENFEPGAIRCLVLIYGLPLKIEGKTVKGEPPTTASLDSEIALLAAGDYPLANWQPNPLFIGNRNKSLALAQEDILLVSRLDGPSEHVVRRIIDHTILAEQNGLTGTAYFDARWPMRDREKPSAYQLYDRSLHLAARLTRKLKKLPVVLEESDKLFQPGEAPDTALYSGWYSLARYVDAFSWRPGSIGYHMASSECSTLKKPKSKVWCKMMLEKGVSATLGPVSEPYIQAFPPPQLFFGLLQKGASLVESYFLSLPHLSWQMVLIGDPLYRPFKEIPPQTATDPQ